MPDVLMYADTFRSPELRHEVPLGVPDPFLYVEKDGVKHISIGSMEIPRLAALGLFELHPSEEYGLDDLIAEGKSYSEIKREIPLRAVTALGVTKAVVPESFPLWLADKLRASGVELTVDGEFFDDRRRVKTESQLAGMRRAQRAAEAGMDTARDLLRRAEQNGTGLVLDGEPLTVERVKNAMAQTFAAHGCTADDFIVAPGPQGAVGHDMGSGPISAGVPIVIDIWPRDNESFVFCDMTRTFVVGEVPERRARVAPPLQGGARPCGLRDQGRVPTAVRSSTGRARSSRRRARRPSARRRRASRSRKGSSTGSATASGSRCTRRRAWGSRRRRTLEAGDVVTVEPGCYRQGYGGVRLEDLVLVTEAGRENLTQYPYDLAP